jgi:hypothetical protein
VAGIDLDKVVEYVKANGGARELALSSHDGVPGKVVRLASVSDLRQSWRLEIVNRSKRLWPSNSPN